MLGVGSQVSNGDVIKHCGGRAVIERRTKFPEVLSGEAAVDLSHRHHLDLGSIFWHVRHPEIQKEIDKSVEEEDDLWRVSLGEGWETFCTPSFWQSGSVAASRTLPMALRQRGQGSVTIAVNKMAAPNNHK